MKATIEALLFLLLKMTKTQSMHLISLDFVP